MATYNFSELSAFEFEELCRDLLQAELGVSLELFAPGPDGGIDIRYIGRKENEDHTIVGQCKRWAEHSYPDLLRHLSKEELPKIVKLAPQRYILLTSVSLTPERKNNIIVALRPWIQTPRDVMGKHDISGLLTRHSEVERRHIKLWLTSTEVLDALMNSDIFNRSEHALDRAKHQLRLWVPNESFTRAREILDGNRVCVISGLPGIGKTMLANILSAGYTSSGFQLVAISGDIEEGNRAWRSDVRQIFLYDDFLGHITYGELRLRKNEDSRLAQFLDRVRSSENKKCILTTREYILSEALNRYERLSDVELAASKNIITLEDYTEPIRGRILYNHLFFSELPSHLKTALLPNKRYWDVIHHRNYNPRVIEHAVSLPGVDSLNSDEFVSKFFATLDDPTKVWELIFKNLPDMARRILLAVASLPTQVFLEDVRRVVESLSPGDFDASAFRDAIGMVEGTFIDLREATPGSTNHQRVLRTRDPSVRDYLWALLKAADGEADMLLRHAVFFEQCIILYEGRNHANSMFHFRIPSRGQSQNVVDHELVARRAVDLIGSISPVVRRLGDEDSEYVQREKVSLERRASFLLYVSGAHQDSGVVAAAANSALATTIEAWEAGGGSHSDGLELLRQAMKVEHLVDEDVMQRAGRALLGLITRRLQQKEDFEVLVALSTLKPDLFEAPQRDLESWGSEFEDFLDGERYWLLEELDDPDLLEEELSAISQIAPAIGMDISQLKADAERRIAELRTEWEPDEYSDIPDFYPDPPEELEREEIDALFQSLR